MSIAERVTALVEQKPPGSVNAAAKGIGITTSTLLRIATGTTQSPSTQSLSAIATFYGTSIEWVLTGKGQSPLNSPQSTDRFEWDSIVRSLDLDEDDHAILAELPYASMAALYSIIITEGPVRTLPIKAPRVDGRVRETREFEAAVRKERQGWIQIFREWIRQAGIAAVRATVIQHRDLFARRFVGMEPVIVTMPPEKKPRRGSR